MGAYGGDRPAFVQGTGRPDDEMVTDVVELAGVHMERLNLADGFCALIVRSVRNGGVVENNPGRRVWEERAGRGTRPPFHAGNERESAHNVIISRVK